MKRRPWDHCLKLQGTTPARMPMARLAAYLSDFAALLGEEAKPTFAGLVSGSAILRAVDTGGVPTRTRARMAAAAADPDAPGHRPYLRLVDACRSDGLRGKVLDNNGGLVLDLVGAVQTPERPEYIVNDVVDVDGVVVAVEGTDDTAHLRLLDEATGQVTRLQVRSMALAQQAARHFRGAPIRVKTHGTWRRDVSGRWHPHSLYADAIVEIDTADVLSVLAGLRAQPGHSAHKSSPGEAEQLLAELRSDD